MTSYMLFGVRGADLEAARLRVEGALHLAFIAHESGYHCGAYFRSGDVGTEHFILQRNHDDVENEWSEPSFQEYPFILYANETLRPTQVRALLERVADLLTTQDL